MNEEQDGENEDENEDGENEEQDGVSTLKTDLTNLNFPNGIFINGMTIILNDTSACQETPIGMNIEIYTMGHSLWVSPDRVKMQENFISYHPSPYYVIYLSKDLEVCSDNDVECETEKIVPDPRRFDLPEDYIYVEQEWGSLFYKYVGKRNSYQLREHSCSADGPHVHLPIPRFHDENEFYRTLFGQLTTDWGVYGGRDWEGMWLDVTFNANKGVQSAKGHTYIKYTRTLSDVEYQEIDKTEWEYLAEIKYHDWINLSLYGMGQQFGEKNVRMDEYGEWVPLDWDKFNFWGDPMEDDYHNLDTVCVFNIIPDSSCSKCQDESFCRYRDSERKETECVCQKISEGEFCEIDLCSQCQNGGYCDVERTRDDHGISKNEIQCICPYGFYGEKCECKSLMHITYL